MKAFRYSLLFMAVLLCGSAAMAQIPVEVFAGDKKSTLDVMFFKLFKNEQGQNSRWLFFNRNRAVIDYNMTSTAALPQFGFTEAVSYNHEKLKGFAPVMVAGILNSGFYPKAGVQYAKVKKDFLLFSWVVAETVKQPKVDFFLLVRYCQNITERTQLFSQVELVNAFSTDNVASYAFVQRLRLGLKKKETQFGLGADLSSAGKSTYTTTTNTGIFLRYEF